MLLHAQLIQLISNGLMSAAAWSSGKARARSELEVMCPVAFHQTGPSPHFLSSCHSKHAGYGNTDERNHQHHGVHVQWHFLDNNGAV